MLQSLLMNVVDNPFHALASGNFIGILAWAIGLASPYAMPQTPPNAWWVTSPMASPLSSAW